MTDRLTITHLSHDIGARKSFVSFVWSDDPAKRLGLEVPYGTTLETVEAVAKQAIADFREELGRSEVGLPQGQSPTS